MTVETLSARAVWLSWSSVALPCRSSSGVRNYQRQAENIACSPRKVADHLTGVVISTRCYHQSSTENVNQFPMTTRNDLTGVLDPQTVLSSTIIRYQRMVSSEDQHSISPGLNISFGVIIDDQQTIRYRSR